MFDCIVMVLVNVIISVAAWLDAQSGTATYLLLTGYTIVQIITTFYVATYIVDIITFRSEEAD